MDRNDDARRRQRRILVLGAILLLGYSAYVRMSDDGKPQADRPPARPAVSDERDSAAPTPAMATTDAQDGSEKQTTAAPGRAPRNPGDPDPNTTRR